MLENQCYNYADRIHDLETSVSYGSKERKTATPNRRSKTEESRLNTTTEERERVVSDQRLV